MLLYVLQGIVFGLVGGVQMLMIPRLTTSQHATLGMYSLLHMFISYILYRTVEMFELVPKVRQRQFIVLETDRKS